MYLYFRNRTERHEILNIGNILYFIVEGVRKVCN